MYLEPPWPEIRQPLPGDNQAHYDPLTGVLYVNSRLVPYPTPKELRAQVLYKLLGHDELATHCFPVLRCVRGDQDKQQQGHAG